MVITSTYPRGCQCILNQGTRKIVTLVELCDHQVIKGGSSIAQGPTGIPRTDKILRRLKEKGFAHTSTPTSTSGSERIDPCKMDRQTYASMYGPTTGDLTCLGATDLWVKIEKDFAVYGDKCTFGGGKTIRDGVGQASGERDACCLDLVITIALVVDWSGIFTADIGVVHGVTVCISRA